MSDRARALVAVASRFGECCISRRGSPRQSRRRGTARKGVHGSTELCADWRCSSGNGSLCLGCGSTKPHAVRGGGRHSGGAGTRSGCWGTGTDAYTGICQKTKQGVFAATWRRQGSQYARAGALPDIFRHQRRHQHLWRRSSPKEPVHRGPHGKTH